MLFFIRNGNLSNTSESKQHEQPQQQILQIGHAQQADIVLSGKLKNKTKQTTLQLKFRAWAFTYVHLMSGNFDHVLSDIITGYRRQKSQKHNMSPLKL